MTFSSRSSGVTPRRTAIVVGVAAALGVGALAVVPGVGDAAPTGTASAAVAPAASQARSSSALTRSLAALSRTGAVSASSVPVTAAVGTAAAVATARTSRTPVLTPGARGKAVKLLQRKLGVKRTGWYGPLTLKAVKRFQRAHDLPSKGYVGPRTWSLLLAKKKPARKTTASRSTPRPPVTAGRVCPAPNFTSWGQGWGASRGSRSHIGMDMMGRRGSPIVAIESGYIVREGRQSNGALRIVMQGVSGSKFYYGHMDKDLVRAGARVTRGQVIGLMGDTGSPGAVHLHFEYWKSGGESDAVDPKPLLRSIC
jgi:murein DD-endopeptidase MepM/ murein hydrolase activator NlpD